MKKPNQSAVAPKMKVAGVLFDLFGTIVVPFSKHRHSHALRLAAEALGLDPVRCDAAWNADYVNRVRGNSGGIAKQLRAFALTEGIELRGEQLDCVVQSYATFCDDLMIPVPTAVATLRWLAEQSVPVGLVSNAAPDFVARDEPASVAGILRDLVETGLVYRTGIGETSVYRIAPADDLKRAMASEPLILAAYAWTVIYRRGPLSRDALAEALPVDVAELDRALDSLVSDGRAVRTEADSGAVYESQRMLLPLGEAAGWEAGVLDHYHAVVGALCAKLRNGQTRALPADQLGGSTFSFDVWRGHPQESRVLALLTEHRAILAALWDEVVKASERDKPEAFTRVTFYCGQLVTREGNWPERTEEA